MPVAPIKQYNPVYNRQIQKTVKQNVQSILESLEKTKELLIINPKDKIAQSILDDELYLLKHNRYFY